jgi:N-glycosylase/DNA lyase
LLDEETWTLRTVVRCKRPVEVEVFEDNGLCIRVNGRVGQRDVDDISSAIAHILRFDENLSGFFRLARSNSQFAWINKHKAGRLLRSATVFEDLIKTICTTNCTWALTRIMVTNLVEKLGDESGAGVRAFPGPDAMAAATIEFYQKEIKAGYRGPYLKEVAELVASGRLDPESWLQTDIPTSELKKEIKRIKGVGDYAAENLLKLLGRYDGLALDSWLRSNFFEKHRNGLACDDSEIHEYYERFGEWRGLFIWLEMTRKWF